MLLEMFAQALMTATCGLVLKEGSDHIRAHLLRLFRRRFGNSDPVLSSLLILPGAWPAYDQGQPMSGLWDSSWDLHGSGSGLLFPPEEDIRSSLYLPAFSLPSSTTLDSSMYRDGLTVETASQPICKAPPAAPPQELILDPSSTELQRLLGEKERQIQMLVGVIDRVLSSPELWADICRSQGQAALPIRPTPFSAGHPLTPDFCHSFIQIHRRFAHLRQGRG